MNELPFYPMNLYLFDASGKYDPKDVVTIQDDAHLYSQRVQTAITGHIKAGLEVRVTDPFDNCLLHAQGGEVIFPKGVTVR